MKWSQRWNAAVEVLSLEISPAVPANGRAGVLKAFGPGLRANPGETYGPLRATDHCHAAACAVGPDFIGHVVGGAVLPHHEKPAVAGGPRAAHCLSLIVGIERNAGGVYDGLQAGNLC